MLALLVIFDRRVALRVCCQYRALGLMKIYNMCKSDLPIIYSVCEKVWFMINGPSKMHFVNFWLFALSKFEMAIVKNLIMYFESSC